MSTTTAPAGASAYFSPDYFHARDRFLALARSRGARIASQPITARGPNGETLFIDTAYFGAEEPRRLLVVVSGTHGVEGFAGSAIQQQWLDRSSSSKFPADAGCLLIHALNPYGFAWLRRTNEHNVDLNRNALDRFPGPSNAAYKKLDAWLNPASPPRFIDGSMWRGAMLLWREGFASLQQAIVEGQYEFPRGLFYGGERREESTRILFDLLSDARWRNAERIFVIDIHTGVGEFATYKLMVDFEESSAPYARLREWFGAPTLASNRPTDSLAYRVNGGLTESIGKHFARTELYAAVLEFGTVSPFKLFATLRRENRAYHHMENASAARRNASAALRDVFCPHDMSWRERILEQGARVLQQAEIACFDTRLN